jgi:N-acetylmuramoyl-L-alanine amidase
MAKAMFNAFSSYKLSYEGKTASEVPNNQSIISPPPVVKDTTQKTPSSEVFFSVQVVSSAVQLDLSSTKFKGEKVYEYFQDNLYKYYTGIFVKDLDGAKKHKLSMQEKGFSSAFVIAFSQGERISIEKAIKLAEK